MIDRRNLLAIGAIAPVLAIARPLSFKEAKPMSVEPLPAFPLTGIIKSVATSRTIDLFASRTVMNTTLAHTLTDDEIKNSVYRRAVITVGTYTMMLTDAKSIITNPDGSVTFMAQKGLSGESSLITF